MPLNPTKWIAIAAMAENRVIGAGNQIPWHIADDFKFFKKTTMGHVLVMGRKTWDSIGRPLPGRETIVVSRTATVDEISGATIIRSLDDLYDVDAGERTVFIAGGGEIYRQLLPKCSEILLSRVKMTPAGDAWFPVFEDQFRPIERLVDHPEFETIRWGRR
ncbi:MAG: dihydrofolate reductase [Verrucomicrobiota bacterium]